MRGDDQFMVGSTTLPPNIDGQLRRHVILEIPHIKWIIRRPNVRVCVSVLWWGEEGQGTIFRPSHVANKKTSKKFTRAVYGIISGPTKFKKYLEDMKVMLLNVINEDDFSLVGQAHVPNLSTLSPSHFITGSYPVLDKKGRKIAEIDVFLSIEFLQVRGNTEIPTPDGGLAPVGRSNLFLNDFQVKNKATDENFCIETKNVNPLKLSGTKIGTLNPNDPGIVDSLVNSLEKLRDEMANSCLKVNVHSTTEAQPNFTPSNISSLQPANLILNTILDDDSSQIRSLDGLALMGNNELFDLFYQNLSDSDEHEDAKVMETKESLWENMDHLHGNRDLMKNLPLKVKKDLSQATGILLLVNNFSYTAANKQFVKEIRGVRGIPSEYMLSVYISKSYNDQEQLTKMKPLLLKMNGQVLQFNQKIVLNKSSLNLHDEDISKIFIGFKLFERNTGLKLKLMGYGRLCLPELLMRGYGEPLKLNLNDKTGISIGSLEIKMKMLFEGRDKLGYCDDDVKLPKEMINNHSNKQADSKNLEENKSQFYDIPMYACLAVPQGQIFSSNSKERQMRMESVTLVVRTHWSESLIVKGAVLCRDEAIKMSFHLIQIYPVSLSNILLNKMKNNYIVIEAWMSINARQKLLGISKLPVDSFFKAFNNEESFELTKNSNFPVVAVDGDVSILCPSASSSFANNSGGSLQVLLAMGTYSQILYLQDFKMKTSPELFRDSSQQLLTSLEKSQVTHSWFVEHTLEIQLESISEMSEVMGNREECFVEFNFPKLQQGNFQQIIHQTSSATIFGSEVIFNESFLQVVTLPNNVPLCWHICKAFSDNKMPNEIIFQLWSRSLFQDISATPVAKGVLTLDELYKVLDLKVQHDQRSPEFFVKMFKSSSHGMKDKSCCGILKVKVLHSSSKKDGGDVSNKANPLVQHASLAVSVKKACGLRRQIQLLPQKKWNFPRSINSFLEVSLTILDQTNTKVTGVAEGTFTPDFNTHFEFLVPLFWSHCVTTDEKSAFLSEVFKKASLEIKVYCTSEDDRDVKTSCSSNNLIGKVKILLSRILERHTGLRGWFTIESPQYEGYGNTKDRSPKHVGGIEVDVKFLQNGDLNMILEAGRITRWSPKLGCSSGTSLEKHLIQLKIDQLTFSRESISLNGLDSTKKCYITYKFFDKGAVFSDFCPMSLWNETYQVEINHIKNFQISLSPSFSWYLAEEKLEVQVWTSHQKSEGRSQPQVDDEYVGSGYVCLSELEQYGEGRCISSGYCPLFNARSEHLGCASFHYTLLLQMFGSETEQDKDGALLKDDKAVMTSSSEENHFLARIVIERAYHLTAIFENGIQALPSAYVTFQASDSFERTWVVESDCNPIWNYEADVWLSKEFLVGGEHDMILKLWHKVKGKPQNDQNDRYLGFASIDLKPLLTKEFQTVSGFYNVNNFHGSQGGQIKVSITPLQSVHATAPQPEIGMSKEVDQRISDVTEFVTRDITDALEALTTGLKQKMSQDFGEYILPRTANTLKDRRLSEHQHFEKSQGKEDEFPFISLINCISEHHDKHECSSTPLDSSLSGCTSKNEDAAKIESQSHRTSPGLNVLNDRGIPLAATNELDAETSKSSSDVQINTEPTGARPESTRSVHSEEVSNDDISVRKNALIGDWLSEHKRKVSERIVAFKSFKIPSFEQSQRLAKILAAKFQDK